MLSTGVFHHENVLFLNDRIDFMAQFYVVFFRDDELVLMDLNYVLDRLRTVFLSDLEDFLDAVFFFVPT